MRRTADGDVAIDVRGLFTSLRYRFAIEARNEARDERGESATISVTSECQAPSALHVPPPTSVRIALEHERLVHVLWRPPLPLGYLRSKRTKPPFSGYVIVCVRSLSLAFIKKNAFFKQQQGDDSPATQIVNCTINSLARMLYHAVDSYRGRGAPAVADD